MKVPDPSVLILWWYILIIYQILPIFGESDVVAVWKVWNNNEWNIYPPNIQQILCDTFGTGILFIDNIEPGKETDKFLYDGEIHTIIAFQFDFNTIEFQQTCISCTKNNNKIVHMDYVSKDNKKPIISPLFPSNAWDYIDDELRIPVKDYTSTSYSRALNAVTNIFDHHVAIWKFTDKQSINDGQHAFYADVAAHLELNYGLLGINTFIVYSSENVIPRQYNNMHDKGLVKYYITMKNGQLTALYHCIDDVSLYGELFIDVERYKTRQDFWMTYPRLQNLLFDLLHF